MSANATRVADYPRRAEQPPDGYHSRIERGYKSRGPSLSVVPREAELPSLGDALAELQSGPFLEKMAKVHQGRELHVLRAEPIVLQLRRVFESAGGEFRDTVEQLLDGLFNDLRSGEDFEHAVVVAGILVALQEAQPQYFKEVATILAQSTAAELATIRELSRRLLAA